MSSSETPDTGGTPELGGTSDTGNVAKTGVSSDIGDFDDNGDHTPSTTHAEWGAGNPRLLATNDDQRMEFPLDGDEITIGSEAGCAILLPGIDLVHASIHHDDRDEYVLTLHGPGNMNANPDAAATHPGERSETLRTGASFTAGPWRFVFMRDEYADHGRPYGGREGGELSDQHPQPARPDYANREQPGESGVWEVQND